MTDNEVLEIKLMKINVYNGPNIWHYKKIIEFQVDIGDLENHPSTHPRIKPIINKLLEFIPSLHSHTCSYGEPGGFVRRLTEDGTYMAHIMEHVSIEISCLAGNNISYGKARMIRGAPESHYRVIYEFIEEKVAREAGLMVLDLLNDLLANKEVDFQKMLEEVIIEGADTAFGPTAKSIIDAAKERDIPVIRLDPEHRISLSQLGWGKNQKRIQASMSTQTSNIAVDIAQDKELSLQLLYDVGIPVPKGGVCKKFEETLKQVKRIGYPVVVKPVDASKGRGITINVNDDETLEKAYNFAREYSRRAIVEKYIQGNDYRLLVINYKFVAAAQRIPARVSGDGRHTIGELVDITNNDPRRGIGHEKELTRIVIDESSKQILNDQGYKLSSIPEKDSYVQLKRTGNLSTGGEAIDVTDKVHIDNIELAERAARVIGLDIAGVDVVAQRVDKPITEIEGGIVEINAAPGFRMHVAPSHGEPRDVGGHVIDMLFPPNSPSRIPLISVTGTNGKTTTVRMIAHILKMGGYQVGLTTTDGIYINGKKMLNGDMTGPWSARMVLRDPTVNIAVLETARGGILRAGLGWDRCDVSAILNIAEDHLGLKEVENLSDLADIKGMIFECTSKDGFGLVNLDDENCYKLRKRLDGKICYLTIRPEDHKDVLNRHFRRGGLAITYSGGLDGMITFHRGTRKIPVLKSTDIPATFKGAATHNICNAMFAIGASLVTSYVDLTTVRQGLQTFHTSYFQTPGRLNIIDYKENSKIILDYAHNPSAFSAIIATIKNLVQSNPVKKVTGVIAMPGDRPEKNIREVGVLVSYFDEIVIKEDDNKRGRPEGEVANILKDELAKQQVADEKIKIIINEKEAIAYALEKLGNEQILFISADDIERSFNQIQTWINK
ncbi:MAG: Cyanophycin synthetase [Candidatus Heimdallarchaeota archaeon LC_3]|nr:MAG: Cyanophycin synthetase [Candidatus Heimdallarchaeota archaeon LC_3]